VPTELEAARAELTSVTVGANSVETARVSVPVPNGPFETRWRVNGVPADYLSVPEDSGD